MDIGYGGDLLVKNCRGWDFEDGDAQYLKGLGDESFDFVYSSHNLEHLCRHEVPIALHEFHRVICAGGALEITVPDLQGVAKHVAEGNLTDPLYTSMDGDPIAPIDILFGFGKSLAAGNGFYAHKTGFTAKSLGDAMEAAGVFGDDNQIRDLRIRHVGVVTLLMSSSSNDTIAAAKVALLCTASVKSRSSSRYS